MGSVRGEGGEWAKRRSGEKGAKRRLEGSRFGSNSGGPTFISNGACLIANLLKQAAPEDVSPRVRSRPIERMNISERNDGQNIACGNSREPPVSHNFWPSLLRKEYYEIFGLRSKAACPTQPPGV